MSVLGPGCPPRSALASEHYPWPAVAEPGPASQLKTTHEPLGSERDRVRHGFGADDERVRVEALYTLACDRCKENACRPEKARSPQAIHLLLDDRNKYVRSMAAEVVGRWVHVDESAAAALGPGDEDREPSVREEGRVVRPREAPTARLDHAAPGGSRGPGQGGWRICGPLQTDATNLPDAGAELPVGGVALRGVHGETVEVFERFTDRARMVVVLAQEESRRLNHNFIGTEHVLLGLVREAEGVAGQALQSLGIRLDAVRVEVEETIGSGAAAPSVIFRSPHAPRWSSSCHCARRFSSATITSARSTSFSASSVRARASPRKCS